MEGGQRLKHVCKFCSKSFACGRSLGGHIRCHLPKPGYELRENPKKTWRVAADHHQGEATTASSETNTENLGLSKLNQGHGKSKRSGLAGNNTNNSHSSVSEEVEAEHQQDEVDIAMCLIMLSRDVGPWGCGKNSQNSKKKRKRSSEKVTAVNGEKQVTVTSHEHLQKGLKMKGIDVSGVGFLSNDKSKNLSESKMGKDRCEDYSSENVRKGENLEEFQESENGFLTDENGMNSEWFKVCTPEKNYCKRSKFECTTCNKVFHSYQALGGHRASHKKQLGAKDCAVTQSNRDDQELTKIRRCPSPQPDVEQLQPTQCDDGDQVFTEIVLGSSSTLSKKVVQKHECPICFRVFPSGHALGGHKRSHQLASSNSQSTKTADVTERSSNSETRDMLDLNLPPAVVHVQEEANATIATASSSNSLVGLIKPYWWVENPHKHEAFLSLISN